MKKYNVYGMSCASCSARVEKAVSELPGVSSCSVSLLTNSMTIEGDATDADIIAAVSNAGYRADVFSYTNGKDGDERKKHASLQRFIISAVTLIVLMYFSMGNMMWGWKVPGFLEGNFVALGFLQMILATVIIALNFRFFIGGYKSVVNLAPNMDALVAIGSGSAYIYSVVMLIKMVLTGVGDEHSLHLIYHELYFESASMILTLITLGKLLEAFSKGKTTGAIEKLMHLAPNSATIYENGEEYRVNISELQIGSIFVVRPGESIPADGVVTEGISAIDESALSGESIPVDKSVGEKVSAGTINLSGYLKCRATGVGEETTLSHIIKMVSEASEGKAPIARAADKIAGVFVPSVMVISFITFIVWMLLEKDFGYALARAITVLVISCPCALGLATPVAIMVGNGVGAKNGILFKTAEIFEESSKIKTVVFDKTGTVTYGQMSVTDVIPLNGVDEKELISFAYGLEIKSEHPVAKAIVAEAERRKLIPQDVHDFEAVSGMGVRGKCNNDDVSGGNFRFISDRIDDSENAKIAYLKFAKEGKTPLFFERAGMLIGTIAVSDTVREDSRDAVKELEKMKIRTVMLTGDNENTARAIGNQCGINDIISDVMPADKADTVKKLMKRGKVAMVGDGINDAPALCSADVGIAIGAGSDIAIDAADIVLIKSSPSDVPAAIKLSRSTMKNIYENFFWAFIYNIFGIPLAAGLFIPVFGWQLNPMFAAAAMSLSSVSVVMNALRLNLVKIYPHKAKYVYKKTDNKNRDSGKDNKIMKKRIKIEGMMCEHCSKRVKDALERLRGVSEAEVSCEQGCAVITLVCDIPDDVLISTINGEGYKVTDISDT